MKIVLAGDVMTGRGIDQVLRQPSAPRLHEGYVRDARDYVRLAERVNGSIGRGLPDAAIWDRALAWLGRLQPELFVVNLETAVTTSEVPWPGKGIHYRMHPGNVGCLTEAGVRGCTLANNHVLDWGRAGLLETLDVLREAGIATTGAGASEREAWRAAEWTVAEGTTVRLAACATASSGVPDDWAAGAQRPGVALLSDLSEAGVRQVAAALGPRRPGRVCRVVSLHWGANWVARVPDAHRRFAQRLIELDAADLVHGHSSHHPLPFEVHRGRLILYGCGDLINDYEGIDPHGARRSDIGCLYAVTLDDAGGRLQALDIVPLQLRRFRLGEPDAEARAWAWRQLGGDAADATSRLEPLADGRWRWHPATVSSGAKP